jgi:predicted RNase H-like nuclease (RuvC/YqgF family)
LISFKTLDFESWRLKIESLTHEREYLLNENSMLKSRIESLSSKLVSLENSMQNSLMEKERLASNLEKKTAEFDESTKKYTRAEKIAANLEKQYREIRPNARIDYYLLGDVEPSTQLLAALMAQPPPAAYKRPEVFPKLERRQSRRMSILPLGQAKTQVQ